LRDDNNEEDIESDAFWDCDGGIVETEDGVDECDMHGPHDEFQN
jgi:hypothetical protein